MNELHWYGVTVRFSCPYCKLTSAEKMAVSAQNHDPEKINKAVSSQKLESQICHKIPTDGTQIDVHVQPYTHAQLKSLGFSVPAEEPKRPGS